MDYVPNGANGVSIFVGLKEHPQAERWRMRHALELTLDVDIAWCSRGAVKGLEISRSWYADESRAYRPKSARMTPSQ